jgi:hypothetical protein
VVWFRADDTLAFNAAVVRAGNAAMGLWLRAGTWCAQQLTDGHVPRHIAATLGSPAQMKRLVEAGLWHETETGFLFHEWNASNPTRAEVENRRQSEAKKKSAFRQRRAGQDGVSPGDSPVDSPGDSPVDSPGDSPVSRPDPTRPVLEEPPSPPADAGGQERRPSRRKTTQRIPVDWQPSQHSRDLLIGRYPDFDWRTAETIDQFRDYWIGRGEARADWDATWRNRMADFAEGRLRPVNRPTAHANGNRGRWDL